MIDVRLGDARLVLEKEIQENSEKFDILAIDAFSDDSIPVHLLTKEAFEIYEKKIRTEGIIAYHISNIYLDLSKILIPLCHEFDINCALVKNKSVPESRIYSSVWFVMSKNDNFFNYLNNYNNENVKITFRDKSERPKSRYWTDDRNNILPLLKIFSFKIF